MRGAVTGLPTAVPLSGMLPGIYQEDPFTVRFVSGFDDVLAPILSTLDCLPSYFDPALAPEDFLGWLAGWVGLELDESWPVSRQRAAIAHAAQMYRMRGTVSGLRDNLEVLTGGRVQVADSGGVAWSVTPGAELPGQDHPRLAVRVSVADPSAVSVSAVDAVVSAAKPAHVVHRVEVVAP
ncbi:phage tail protein I [Kutzneria sp. NPDC052558]|uniref:phage tail protein I n=1 Tax=Kutzneria sp. NPDC052558 TaxID=3364121 RepID=UPI0037C978DE